MNDWKEIWNYFCQQVALSVKRQKTEMSFEKDIAKEFFMNLGWKAFNRGLQEQYPIKFATANHWADFALFVEGKDGPEIIVELKRPNKKKREEHEEQLLDYMEKTRCSFGILMMGEYLEVHYRDYSAPKSVTHVETIKYKEGNEAAHQLIEILNRQDYESAKMLEYCHKRVKINKSIEYWCSADGKTEIMNMIVERSKLSEQLQETLRSTLTIDVHRRDGVVPISTPTTTVTPVQNVRKASNPTASDAKHKVWMISASPKFFDHRACFTEQGKIYWMQHNKFKVGDTGYIYISKPIQAVVFKFEVLDVDVPYCEEIEVQRKYYKRPEDYDVAKRHNRFYIIRQTGESSSDQMKIANMMQHGLKAAPLGALNLSDPSFSELLPYIEENF